MDASTETSFRFSSPDAILPLEYDLTRPEATFGQLNKQHPSSDILGSREPIGAYEEPHESHSKTDENFRASKFVRRSTRPQTAYQRTNSSRSMSQTAHSAKKEGRLFYDC